MRYAIINKERCEKLGINPDYRKQMGDDVVITEKELSFSAAVGDTIEDKAESEGLSLLTDSEVTAVELDYKQGKEAIND